MVNANELRIGNLLYFNPNLFEGQKNKIVEIETINKDFVTDTINKNTVIGGYENYQPILLDEEWLFKFGFEKTETLRKGVLREYLKKKIRVEMSNSGNFYLKNSLNLKTRNTLQIKEVHQLQNLYLFTNCKTFILH